MIDTPRETWHDRRLGDAVKVVRATLTTDTRAVFEKYLIPRLRYLNKILGDYDKRHEAAAIEAIAVGQMERASGITWLIYNEALQERLLAQINLDTTADAARAAERMQEAEDLGREIL